MGAKAAHKQVGAQQFPAAGIGTGTTTAAVVSKPAQANRFLRILHVNDNTDDQVLFQAACKRAAVPINWHVAETAERGISYLQALCDQPADIPVCWPDVVLLDVVLPDALGFAVLKMMRATPQLSNIPVIVFTGQLNPAYQQQALDLGADHFWLKPSDFPEQVALAKELHRFLSRPPVPSPPADLGRVED